jgi:hypothetical protein
MEKKLLLMLLLFAIANSNKAQAQSVADCAAPSSKVWLDINNVRAIIHNGGDKWMQRDPQYPGYEVPKGSGKHSIYAGGLWIGGLNGSNQLKLAGQTYREHGNDFFPGPLAIGTAQTSAAVCAQYDKHYKITKSEVREFIENLRNPDVQNYTIPEVILNWPAHGNTAQGYSNYLAPFVDVDGNGVYNPLKGDYPGYDFDKSGTCEDRLFGQQTIWWVFNDKGNSHSQTNGIPIGIEIQAQAFAYATNDDIDNATFYYYKLINRSSNSLSQAYFGIWTDGDIGRYTDDYAGCDVERGLGFFYNGTEIDGSGGSGDYGAHPPALGIDFLKGPYMDPDGTDNLKGIYLGQSINGQGFGDGIIDNERFGMERFVSHQSASQGGNPAMHEPRNAMDYYNYLIGLWRDSTPMRYGGTGHQSSTGTSIPIAKFMFPGSSDPLGFGTGGVQMPPWSEETENYLPWDRRFVMSAGPFTLEPGGVNSTIIGVLWARDLTGNHMDAVTKLKSADDLAQQLADNCFLELEVGQKELSKENRNVKLFPNPFSSFTLITFEDKGFAHDIEIYNSSGVLVKTMQNMGGGNIKVEREDIAPGVYFIKVSDSKNKSSIATKKIVVAD